MDFDTIVTDSELEALILENNLIKENRPKYNIQLRDDKQYPYICVTMQEPYPRVIKVRRTRKDGGVYFGPYADGKALNETLALLKKLFPYRSCDLTIPDRGGPSRAGARSSLPGVLHQALHRALCALHRA